VWGSQFAYPASFNVDLGFWRSFDAGRVLGVSACSTRPKLRCWFSWCWFSGFFCLYLYILVSLFTVYLLVVALSQDFSWLSGWSFFSALFTTMACGHWCSLRVVFLASLLLYLFSGFGLYVIPFEASIQQRRFMEFVQKKEKRICLIDVWIYSHVDSAGTLASRLGL